MSKNSYISNNPEHSLVLFDPFIGPYKVLLFRAIMDPGTYMLSNN